MILAFLGVFLGKTLANPYLDPAATILIGILLASVAILLGRETGALLVGGRTSRANIKKIRRIISEDPAVERIGVLMTMQLGPGGALLTAKIRFRPQLRVEQLESAIKAIEQRIRQQEPTIQEIFIEPNSEAEKTRTRPEAA